jgi:thiol:disulfide interchange protein DsbD
MALALLVVFFMPFARAQGGFGSLPKDILTVRASLQPATLQPGQSAKLTLELTVKEPYHVHSNPASEEYLIPTLVAVNKALGLQIGKPVYPAAEEKQFAFYPKPLKVYESNTKIMVPLSLGAKAKVPGSIAGTVRYQACDDKSCLPPANAEWSLVLGGQASASPGGHSTASGISEAAQLRQRFRVSGIPDIVFLDQQGEEREDLRANENLTVPLMLARLEALQQNTPFEGDAASTSQTLNLLRNASLWLQFGLVFIGGFLLNLTPCVYPMIPITVGYFGAQSEGRAGKSFGLAVFYVLGLALTYSMLGVFAALTGNLFGSVLQSAWAVGFVALVLFALGLSMLGVFTLQPPQFILARSGAKQGIWGALAMGALLGIVAAPCVGPIVAALLTYVSAKAAELGPIRGAVFGFGLFFTLALGLGLPYLLLGTFSGSIKSLPRSGPWLERLKKIFAVPLLLAAAYYGYLAFKTAPIQATRTNITAAQSTLNSEWQPATFAALQQAKEQGRAVVLDFRADWCLPCLKLEEEVFSRPEVLQGAKDALLLKVDLTRG